MSGLLREMNTESLVRELERRSDACVVAIKIGGDLLWSWDGDASTCMRCLSIAHRGILDETTRADDGSA